MHARLKQSGWVIAICGAILACSSSPTAPSPQPDGASPSEAGAAGDAASLDAASPDARDSATLGEVCSTADTCPALTCQCSYAKTNPYSACIDGRCATTCPRNDQAAGATCRNGCYCASGTCDSGDDVCCAVTGKGQKFAPCSTGCDCNSGICSGGLCN